MSNASANDDPIGRHADFASGSYRGAMHHLLAIVASVCVVTLVTGQERQTGASRARRQLVAHRGASAYAPEHTLAAYRLAIEQGADYVEQDLAVTRDGRLICLHDESLERTTNVEDIVPERATVDPATGRRTWLAVDFTLAEIRRLDAGS
jgi:glycerophosphoryl diester phosphodiesterase